MLVSSATPDSPVDDSLAQDVVLETLHIEAKKNTAGPVEVVKDGLVEVNVADVNEETEDSPAVGIAKAVLQILADYTVNCQRGGPMSWEDVEGFLPTITNFVQKQEPVQMDKTLGVLPDFGEELALHHLNGLCLNIAQVYSPGAEVHIASDGLVYNDILGVPDKVVWDYGEALRQIAVARNLAHIRFIRLADLLGHPGSTKEFYFLTKDLAHRPKLAKSKRARAEEISQTARRMLARGQIYASAIKAQRGDYVRLSIHESTASRKLSVSLLPQDKMRSIGHTPWHACVVVCLDGTYRTAHADQVRDTHELVYKDGRPYCYRERSELFNWTQDGLGVQFKHLYPCGLVIRPTVESDAPAPAIQSIPMRKVRQLSHHFSPVLCRGFARTEDEAVFIRSAETLGEVLPWTHGIIKKVKDSKRADKLNNNVESSEAMPMHFDGMFKFEHVTDPVTGATERRQAFPRYQFFTCQITSPNDGFTLFASSRLLLRHLPHPWTVDQLRTLTWGMDNDGFWDAQIHHLPLLVTHPVTGRPCLRWHQPWDASQTKFSTCVVTIENAADGGARLIPVIDRLLYDYRVCLRLAWEVGDVLVNDGTAMLHTRTAYQNNADRELWRIHCD
ncbi:Clavaminate synthase-like protein [Aspergillus japonicus CBS 114.51]|uniref:Clavaminate synthase-like protein n=1 Tax=Aspergillus japonicus CBS 114.51 TaxID=1448312 RepID=A0A8T8WTF2_ASPJA|nr:Clavaminate synthase-like protein [Aspergillus japonicus CBS 114.51]RAH79126.1 Clavaminate synthase-like protein [Aspergillus japonicus CBS 114.51]